METFDDDTSGTDRESPHTRLRTVDVARRVGYSVQQIRDLERDGVLPPAIRAPNGYRSYAPLHVDAATAYRQLAAALGPVAAKALLRTARTRPLPRLLADLDAAHAELHTERRELALARQAVAAITDEQIDAPLPSDALTITQLAEAIGVRASTLRHWDAEGLVTPDREPGHRTRVYSPTAVRDARIVRQLRAAGHRVDALRELMPRLRQGRDWDAVTRALATRDATVTARSLALLRAATALTRLFDAS